MATLAEVLRQAGYVTPQGQVVGPRTTTAQTMSNYIRNIIPNAAQNLAQQRSDIDAALTMGDQGIQVGDKAAFERQMAQVPNLMGLTAYHGTPHTIKGKFDISKVGTGEGAQAYGHGMYFAENPAVAKNYATDRSYVGKFMAGTPDKTPWDAQRIAQDTLNVHGDNAIAELQSTLKANSQSKNPKQLEANKQVEEAINLLKTNQLQPTGNLYKVDIPDEYIPNMLDWDKPLSQQPKIVQDAFKNIAKNDPNLPLNFLFKGDATGGSLIQAMDKIKASELLLNQGVKGIRYLDEGSRNIPKPDIEYYQKGVDKLTTMYKANPTQELKFALDDAKQKLEEVKRSAKDITSNFVVFDPSDVKILEQNSKPMTRKEIIEQELEKVLK